MHCSSLNRTPPFSHFFVRFRQLQIFFFVGFDSCGLLRADRANDLTRHPDDKAACRDDRALRHQRPGSNQAAVPDDRTVQDRGVHPDQAVIAHCAAVDDCPVPDGYAAPYRHIQPGACVQHGVILHIGILADDDAARVGAQHRTVPDAALLCKAHTARQRCVLRYKRRTVIGRGVPIYCDKSHRVSSFRYRPTGRRGRRPLHCRGGFHIRPPSTIIPPQNKIAKT